MDNEAKVKEISTLVKILRNQEQSLSIISTVENIVKDCIRLTSDKSAEKPIDKEDNIIEKVEHCALKEAELNSYAIKDRMNSLRDLTNKVFNSLKL